MKFKNLALALVLSAVTSSAFAFFPAHVQWFVNPTVAVARVVNVWGYPVFCQGRVFGITANGVPAHAWFRDFVPAGQFREAYLYTNGYNPFINAHSEVFCQ